MELNADTRKFAEMIFKYLTTSDNTSYVFVVENENPHLKHIQVEIILKTEKKETDGVICRLFVRFSSPTIFSHSERDGFKLYCRVGNFTDYGQTYPSTHPEYLEQAIKKVCDNLQHIIYDKKYDRFILTTDIEAMTKYELEKLRPTLFKHLKKVQKRKEENICGVCLEETLTTTPCGHHLCGECWEQLEKKQCPLCRGDIEYEDGEGDE